MGFQQASNITTLLAPIRLIPNEPALVEMRKTLSLMRERGRERGERERKRKGGKRLKKLKGRQTKGRRQKDKGTTWLV